MSNISVPTVQKFQAGTVTIVSLSLVVNLTSGFVTTPKVVVTPKQDMGNIRHWVENVTISSFTLKLSFSSTKSFDWIAMEF